MTKRQLIDEIVVINRSAKPSFLARFDELDLNEYLHHLQQAGKARLCGDWSRFSRYFSGQPAATQAKQAIVVAAPEASATAVQQEPAVTAECDGAYVDVPASIPAQPAEPVAATNQAVCEDIDIMQSVHDQPEPTDPVDAQPEQSLVRRAAPAMATWLF